MCTISGCLYGDTNPNYCKTLLNDSLGIGNCYDLKGQINCCRTCAEARNDTNKGIAIILIIINDPGGIVFYEMGSYLESEE